MREPPVPVAQQEYGRVLADEIRGLERRLKRLRGDRVALVEVLRDAGCSQRQVAEIVGVTPARVAQWDIARGALTGGARRGQSLEPITASA